ncbi:hypothetical protein BDP27DRAFT_1422118 [Rhodocollybia butyracea]|uniref:Uncharacterized protein n=1 Tax=Rhodocollybia butyracea TaxID=206335 RepID=A0A9P5PUB1_9AGAR|nr:hypothetical protein BDP27DRAFT_1422118 [Rhodocollybia butyracea]
MSGSTISILSSRAHEIDPLLEISSNIAPPPATFDFNQCLIGQSATSFTIHLWMSSDIQAVATHQQTLGLICVPDDFAYSVQGRLRILPHTMIFIICSHLQPRNVFCDAIWDQNTILTSSPYLNISSSHIFLFGRVGDVLSTSYTKDPSSPAFIEGDPVHGSAECSMGRHFSVGLIVEGGSFSTLAQQSQGTPYEAYALRSAVFPSTAQTPSVSLIPTTTPAPSLHTSIPPSVNSVPL